MHGGLIARPAAAASGLKVEGVFACFLPYILAWLFQDSADLSWWTAWLGSWVIVALVFSGRVFTLPADRPLLDQVMRPWFLMHLVFAGYNFLTAIFYWFDINGFALGLAESLASGESDRDLAAKGQRMYVLAHASLVLGIGLVRQVPRYERVRTTGKSPTKILFGVAVGSFLLAQVFSYVPGLAQFEVKLQGLFTVAAAMSLGVAVRERSSWLPAVVGMNVVLFLAALLSGWKGGPIVMIILVASAFYPRAPLRTILAAGALFLAGVIVLPSVSNHIRSTAWSGETTRMEALGNALEDLAEKPADDLMRESWLFLAGRLSEAGLFVKYLAQVPEPHGYYGFSIASQAITSAVPRILWPEKRDLEELVRERVLMHSIVERSVDVSAKPQYVVDAYLSFGAVGIFVAMVVFGMLAQVATNTCVTWLGGYLLGGVAFNGLFAILWQGSAFEFVFNAVLWSFALVFFLFLIGSTARVLDTR